MLLSNKYSIMAISIVLLVLGNGGDLITANGQKTWCIPKPSSNDTTLQGNIDYSCGEIDCQILKIGGPCYEPNNRMNHAAVSMNLYYQANGRNQWNCDFKGSGLIVVTNPSYGSCTYA